MKSNYEPIGNFIQEIKVRNADLKAKKLLGINIDKFFMPSVANVVGTDLSVYKVVQKNQFACNRMHIGRDYRIPIALTQSEEPFMVSPAYDVFEIIDTEVLLPEFLMMWFSRSEFDRETAYYTDADVRGGLTWQSFLEMKFPVPKIETQRAIVAEYNALQNRININQKIIQKLEETAQAIYKEWFVDNRDEEWEVGILSDFVEIKYGKAYSHLKKGKIPLYGSGGIMGSVSESLYDKTSVLIPRKGTLNNIMYINKPFWTVDTMFYSILLNVYAGYYVFLFLKQHDFSSLDQGSAVPSMTTNYLNAMEILIPDNKVLKKFDNIMNSLFETQEIYKRENQKLNEFKTLLLSKLASVK